MTSPKTPNSSQTLAELLGGGAAAKSNRWGVVAVVVIGVTLLLLVYLGAPLLRLRQAVPAPPVAKAKVNDTLGKFDDSMLAYVAQINGRHAFSKPLAKRVVVEAESGPKPTRYDGPGIVAMVNSTVWFTDGQRLEVGQVSKDGDLKVVSLNAPWSAKLAWRKGEFDVDFFQHSPLLTGKVDSWKSSPVTDTPPPTPRASPETPREPRAGAESVPGGFPGTPPPRGNDTPVEVPPPPPPPSAPPQAEPQPAPANPAPTPPPAPAPSNPPPSEPEKTAP